MIRFKAKRTFLIGVVFLLSLNLVYAMASHGRLTARGSIRLQIAEEQYPIWEFPPFLLPPIILPEFPEFPEFPLLPEDQVPDEEQDAEEEQDTEDGRDDSSDLVWIEPDPIFPELEVDPLPFYQLPLMEVLNEDS